MDKGRQQFNVEAAFVARSAFVYDGTSFTAGAPFPWRDLGVLPLKLKQLWGACLVDCLPPAPAALEQDPAAPAPVPPPPAKPAKRARAGA
jgi:hypothetical protein